MRIVLALMMAGFIAGCSQGDTLIERLTGDPPTCDGTRKRAMNRGRWDHEGRGYAALTEKQQTSCG